MTNRCTEQDTIDALAREIEHFSAIAAANEGIFGGMVERERAMREIAYRESSIRARQNTQRQPWHKGDCAYHASK